MAAVNGKLLLIVAGVWVLAQVFGGDALGRLGIAGSGTKPKTTQSGPGAGGGSTDKAQPAVLPTTPLPTLPTGGGLVGV